MRVFPVLFMLACSPKPEPCSTTGNGVGQCAPTLSLPRADGTTWSLQGQSNRVVLVQFAASWCGTCQLIAPEDERLFQEYRSDGFNKVTVLKGDAEFEDANQEDAQEWKDYFGLNHPVVYDETREAWRTWKRDINSLPQMFLVDGTGTIRWRKIGLAPEEELEEQIEEHLRHLD